MPSSVLSKEDVGKVAKVAVGDTFNFDHNNGCYRIVSDISCSVRLLCFLVIMFP